MLQCLIFPDCRNQIVEGQKIVSQCLGKHIASLNTMLATIVKHKWKYSVFIVDFQVIWLQDAVNTSRREWKQAVLDRLTRDLHLVCFDGHDFFFELVLKCRSVVMHNAWVHHVLFHAHTQLQRVFWLIYHSKVLVSNNLIRVVRKSEEECGLADIYQFYFNQRGREFECWGLMLAPFYNPNWEIVCLFAIVKL